MKNILNTIKNLAENPDSFRTVNIAGRLGRNPVFRHVNTKEGRKLVASFPIAFNVEKDQAVWFDVAAWEKVADYLKEKNLQKGQLVNVKARLRVQHWTSRDNVKRQSNKLSAFFVEA
jgi:single-stranded DNA-binding protein